MWIAFPALKKNSCLLETSFSVASALDEIPLGPPLGLASQMPFEDGDTALAPSWDSWLSDRAPLSFRPSAEAPVKGLHEFTLGIVLTILVDTRCLNRIGCQEHSESEFQTRTTPLFAQTNSKDCLLWLLPAASTLLCQQAGDGNHGAGVFARDNITHLPPWRTGANWSRALLTQLLSHSLCNGKSTRLRVGSGGSQHWGYWENHPPTHSSSHSTNTYWAFNSAASAVLSKEVKEMNDTASLLSKNSQSRV